MQSGRRISVVLNGSSGDHPGQSQREAQLRDLMAKAGLEGGIHPVPSDCSITDFAAQVLRDHPDDLVVASGGDGTIAAVAEACHAADRPMGVVPQGTFNFFARGLGIPEDPEGAIEVLARGRLGPVPLCEANGALFLNNASLGIYPLILHRRESIYSRWGRSRLAAYWSVVLALSGFKRPLKLRLSLDGTERRLRTPLAFVAASPYQLEHYNLDGAYALRDGKLVLFTLRETGRGALIRAAWRLARGKATRGSDFDLATAQEITLTTGRKRALLARDGEKGLMHMPVQFCYRDRPLQVMLPDTP